MQREIKSRAWDAETGKMHTRNRQNLAGEDCLMQYIGVKDKNRKEIYEGDIITDGFGRNYEIIFKKGCFGFEVINPINKISMNFANFTNINQEDVYYEVIGNIFENPDLLK